MTFIQPKAEYSAITSTYPPATPRPVIGITANTDAESAKILKGYYQSIEQAGGVPLLLPPTTNRNTLLSLVDRIDGLLLSGGGDVNPALFGLEPEMELGEINGERDSFELLLTRLVYDRCLPILGICRGMQVLTLALGGSVHQDLDTDFDDKYLIKHTQKAERHVPTHSVRAEAGSLMAKLLGEHLLVNSFHHQSVDESGPRLRITATAPDGVAEAVESTELRPVIGVQWHPECFLADGNLAMNPLFRYLVEQSEAMRRARLFHLQNLTLDSHCDTPMFFDLGMELTSRDDRIKVDFHKMSEGGLDVAVMAAYIQQGGRAAADLRAATNKADYLLEEIRRQTRGVHGIELAATPKQVYFNKEIRRRSVMLAIENGYAIGTDLSNIERYRREGVVYITLCHNGDNDICDSARGSRREHGGLSAFGREVVAEMNRTGMVIDLSHASEETFFQVLETSSQPVVCSHSACRALCDNPRNLTDEQLRALGEKDGVVQINLYPGFLSESGEATIQDFVAHIRHAIDVCGIDHVGIGSDFDGDGGVPGCNHAGEFTLLTRALLATGINSRALRKLWGANFLRVVSQVQYAGSVKL